MMVIKLEDYLFSHIFQGITQAKTFVDKMDETHEYDAGYLQDVKDGLIDALTALNCLEELQSRGK